ncbi:carboxypeptidase regulatory-like domain-containing protein [Deinococcus sonorensis]|uniref:Carboxypeptidase regulatory-like domain-containing protein n=2 Tax=Deinococcus sonorensis TaxID=309891 RepID=A0AAU7U4R3_9DEIO
MNVTRTMTALLLTTLLAACGASQTGSPGTPPGTPAPTDASQATPYTMKGTVRNAAGQPLPGVEVWADNTLYYNMNALGRTDAQGRYSIALPKDQLGTWRAGGRYTAVYNGDTYDLGLAADNEAAFSSDTGAVRNFTLRISGKRPGGGYYGGTVWPYFSSHGGNFDIQRVEYTFTPVGPLIDGSAGQPIKLIPQEQPSYDVPIGTYRVTARYVPTDGPAEDMLLMGRNESQWSPSTTITFHNDPQYGPFADFTVSLVPKP